MTCSNILYNTFILPRLVYLFFIIYNSFKVVEPHETKIRIEVLHKTTMARGWINPLDLDVLA